MTAYTRFVRLRPDIDRSTASNEGTFVSKMRSLRQPEWINHAARFNHHQRRMSQILREYPRPGIAVFALHGSYGLAGHVWLEASDTLRAATLGRHGCVDLYLPDEKELSLRHLMVLVRRRAEKTRVKVLDLVTPAGFQAEKEGLLRGLEADGLVVFSAARYTFVAVPTGSGTPWDTNSSDPWRTLPERVPTTSSREAQPSQRQQRGASRNVTTFIASLDGPVEAAPEQLLRQGEQVIGRLSLEDGDNEVELKIGASAIARGVVLGRYDRCAGCTVVDSNMVSRVHAVLIEVDGKVHLIDAGSSNGTTLDEQPCRCAPIEERRWYKLASMGLRWCSSSN